MVNDPKCRRDGSGPHLSPPGSKGEIEGYSLLPSYEVNPLLFLGRPATSDELEGDMAGVSHKGSMGVRLSPSPIHYIVVIIKNRSSVLHK